MFVPNLAHHLSFEAGDSRLSSLRVATHLRYTLTSRHLQFPTVISRDAQAQCAWPYVLMAQESDGPPGLSSGEIVVRSSAGLYRLSPANSWILFDDSSRGNFCTMRTEDWEFRSFSTAASRARFRRRRTRMIAKVPMIANHPTTAATAVPAIAPPERLPSCCLMPAGVIVDDAVGGGGLTGVTALTFELDPLQKTIPLMVPAAAS